MHTCAQEHNQIRTSWHRRFDATITTYRAPFSASTGSVLNFTAQVLFGAIPVWTGRFNAQFVIVLYYVGEVT